MKAMNTEKDVREAVQEVAKYIVDDYKDKPNASRETLIVRIHGDVGYIFSRLFPPGLSTDYTIDDLNNLLVRKLATFGYNMDNDYPFAKTERKVTDGMKTITEKQVRKAVSDSAKGIINEFIDKLDTSHKTLIERINAEAGAIFDRLVQAGAIPDYTLDDLIATAQPCIVIIQVAKANGCVVDEPGVWGEHIEYGLANVALFSLRNLLCEELDDRGCDCNDDCPFAIASGMGR